ncbi:MAG TPA: DUF2950 domain-containing protein [Pyrinomonadaceae bacterium]|jgi:hypothetical protein
MKRKIILKTALLKLTLSGILFSVSMAGFACLLILGAGLTTRAQEKGTVSKEKQTTFAKPEEAAEALVSAIEKFDEPVLLEILGQNSYDIIHSGDAVYDKDVGSQFAGLARKSTKIVYDKRNRNLSYMSVGEDGWQFPIPIVRKGKTWYFDTQAGRQEILYRRIGRNELDAIDVCRGYVEAQHEYALTKHDGALVNQFAQRIISSPGKQDGLAWQNADGKWGGTVGERAAKEIEKSYTGKPAPFHGYYFKILTKQAPIGHVGAIDYVQNGVMIGGFALLAYPAVYRSTGVKTFMVSHDGVVYEKDLGPDTATLAAAIDTFSPDLSWSPTFDDIE